MKNLYLIEDYVENKFSEEAHEILVFKLKQLQQKDEIKLRILVPAEKRYQFIVTCEDKIFDKVLLLFHDARLLFRFEVLLNAK
jgi:hypothetical protein